MDNFRGGGTSHQRSLSAPNRSALRDFNLHTKKLISVRKYNCIDRGQSRAPCTGYRCKDEQGACGCNVKKPCQCVENYLPKTRCGTNSRYSSNRSGPRSLSAPQDNWSDERVRTALHQLRLKISEKLEQLKSDKIGGAAKRSLRANYLGLDADVQKQLEQLRKQQVTPAKARANMEKLDRIYRWNSTGQDEYVDFYKDVDTGFRFWPF